MLAVLMQTCLSLGAGAVFAVQQCQACSQTSLEVEGDRDCGETPATCDLIELVQRNIALSFSSGKMRCLPLATFSRTQTCSTGQLPSVPLDRSDTTQTCHAD